MENKYLKNIGVPTSAISDANVDEGEIQVMRETMAKFLFTRLSTLSEHKDQLNQEDYIQIGDETATPADWVDRCVVNLQCWLQSELVEEKMDISSEEELYAETLLILSKIHPYLYY